MYGLPNQGRLTISTAAILGLPLRVSFGGGKAFTYHCRVGGKQRRVTFRAFPRDDARSGSQGVAEGKEATQAGRDPSKRREAGAADFDGVFEEWLKRDQAQTRLGTRLSV